MADAWRPTSELERRLQGAVRAGDQEGYFRLISDSELLVPVPPEHVDGVLANETRPTWPTQEEDGRVHVLVYTSTAAMRACLGPSYRHFLTLRFGDIAQAWPDARWWLAIDVAARGDGTVLPIEARLPSWFVRQVAEGDGRPPQVGPAPAPWEELRDQHRELPRAQSRPEFQPANDVERELLRAAAGDDHDLFLQTLAGTEVLLPVPDETDYSLRPGRPGFPWQTREVDGSTVVPVFTSPERLTEAAHAAGTGTEHIRLPFTVMLRYWPHREWALAVNSGSPAGGTVLAQQLPGLATWADQRAAQRMTDGFEPQNDIEQRLFDAARRRDTDAFVKILLGAQVLVPADAEAPWGIAPGDPEFPWRPVPVHGRTSVQLFTSLKWMNEAIGSSRFIMPSLREVAQAWPDAGWTLVLNPGTPIDLSMPGEQLRGLSVPAAPPSAAVPPPPESPSVPVAPPVPADPPVPGRHAAAPHPSPAASGMPDVPGDPRSLPAPGASEGHGGTATGDRPAGDVPGGRGVPYESVQGDRPTEDAAGRHDLPRRTAQEHPPPGGHGAAHGYAADTPEQPGRPGSSPGMPGDTASEEHGMPHGGTQGPAGPGDPMPGRHGAPHESAQGAAGFGEAAELGGPGSPLPGGEVTDGRSVPHANAQEATDPSSAMHHPPGVPDATGAPGGPLPSGDAADERGMPHDSTQKAADPSDAMHVPGEHGTPHGNTQGPVSPGAPGMPGSHSHAPSIPDAAGAGGGPGNSMPGGDAADERGMPHDSTQEAADPSDAMHVPGEHGVPHGSVQGPVGAGVPGGHEHAAGVPDTAGAPGVAVRPLLEAGVGHGGDASGLPGAGFEPGNRIDQELYEAAAGGDSDAFLRVLLNANVLVPIPEDAPLEATPVQPGFRWDAALRGDAGVQVFTSLVRLKEVVPEGRFVYADFRELIGAWPRDEWTMLLNPGTRIGASLRGEQVRELNEWAVRAGPGSARMEVPAPRPETAPEPASDPDDRDASPTIMQKVVPHELVPWYLEQGYDRVGGYVHSTGDVAELQTPAQLYETLGLLHEQSPFSPADEGVYVIRWPAYCPDLYRIPFGGRNEEEMAAWGEAGWVVERPPFVGSGFAPGSAGSIREYKVDSVRLPYGAEMYHLGRDRAERFVAMYDPDRLAWLRPEDARTEAGQ